MNTQIPENTSYNKNKLFLIHGELALNTHPTPLWTSMEQDHLRSFLVVQIFLPTGPVINLLWFTLVYLGFQVVIPVKVTQGDLSSGKQPLMERKDSSG